MIYGSVCSGIEAPTVAWRPLGWTAAFFSEIDRFPCEVLAHHYGCNMPDKAWSHNSIPNLGDMSGYERWPQYPIDILVGGIPCQDFSIAGLRAGLAGDRGNLAITFAKIAGKYRPRWLVWENVPGVLSSADGRDFASILGLLSGQKITPPKTGWKNAGVLRGYQNAYGLSWRVLDAQYVRVDGFRRAVPQRRRRVFLIGYLGDWRRAAAVLFDRESLRGNSPPRRKTGQSIAALATTGIRTCDADENQADAGHLIETFDRQSNDEHEPGEISSTISARDFKTATDLITYTCTLGHSQSNGIGVSNTGVANTLEATASSNQAIVFDYKQMASASMSIDTIAPTSRSSQQARLSTMTYTVRRLTPVECERLMGFPEGYTKINNKAADGPRYKALGNSMAVNCMRWIGRRIEQVEAVRQVEAAE